MRSISITDLFSHSFFQSCPMVLHTGQEKDLSSIAPCSKIALAQSLQHTWFSTTQLKIFWILFPHHY